MRKLTVKYDGGVCAKCGATLEIGAPAMYEKRTGIFCVGCEPVEVENIRAYRQAKANKRAERRELWAAQAEAKSHAHSQESQEMMSVIPMGQPILAGHSEGRDRRYRQRAWDKMGRSVEEANKAEHHRNKAKNLRHVRVAGDAKREREQQRAANDLLIGKESIVQDPCFGRGKVLMVYKKSYRIKFSDGFICSRDKSYVVLCTEE